MKFISGSLLLSMLLLVSLVSACSCVQPGSVKEEFNISDSVFLGKVLSVNTDLTEYISVIKFDTDLIYKGQDIAEIKTSASSASCGYNFEQGEDYLVYAREIEGETFVSLCSRTALAYDSEEDLAYLNSTLIDYTEEDKPSDQLPDLTLWQKIVKFFGSLFR
jgi:hypothetical protein